LLALSESRCQASDIRTFSSNTGSRYELRVFAGNLRRGPDVLTPFGIAPVAVSAAVVKLYRGQACIGLQAFERGFDVTLADGTVKLWDLHLLDNADIILQRFVADFENGKTLPNDASKLV
jgi:hypothetical protein